MNLSKRSALSDRQIVNIEDSIDKTSIIQSVTERYYTIKFCTDVQGKEGEDHCVLFHSNRICLITLAKSHPIIKDKKTISRIDFQISTNVDRSKNKVSGKGKHGAQLLQPHSPLCFIDCEDGSKFCVSSCIKGKLVEVNDALLVKPELLIDKPLSDGYIAIILPNLNNIEALKSEMLGEAEYLEKVNKRSK